MAKHKYIETPEKLWELFKDYVIYERDNPMHKVDYVGKEGRLEKTPLETPITFEGFENYLEDRDIINDLGHYSSNEGGAYTAYLPIITRIKRNCFVHNYKGASVGLFNANLIARKLGIKEGTDITSQGEKINEIKVTIVSGNQSN
jgi:hypothetical protein